MKREGEKMKQPFFYTRLARAMTWRLVVGTSIASAGGWCLTRLDGAGFVLGLLMVPVGMYLLNRHLIQSAIIRKIRKDMVKQIHADLTIGFSDENAKPYTDEEIAAFINANNIKIEAAVWDFYRFIAHDIVIWEMDWIRESLYEFVFLPNNVGF